MLIEHTLDTLTCLKLSGMKQALQQQLEHPNTFSLSFEERFGLLVDYEKNYRQENKIQRLLKAAHLRHCACIEEVDYNQSRGLRREDISLLASCNWVKEAFTLIVTGPTGCGKTWIGCALSHHACRKGFSVLYTRIPRLLEQLRLSHSDGSYVKLMARLLKIDVLILDDWGLECFTGGQRRDVLELIEERHTFKSLTITSQLPVAKWHEMIGDPTLADAILDRILHKHYKLELRGESMRKITKTLDA